MNSFMTKVAIAVVLAVAGCKQMPATADIEGEWTLDDIKVTYPSDPDQDLVIEQMGTVTIGDGKMEINYDPVAKLLLRERFTYVKDAAAKQLTVTVLDETLFTGEVVAVTYTIVFAYTATENAGTLTSVRHLVQDEVVPVASVETYRLSR